MIREDRFLISRRPYAVDLSSLVGGEHHALADAKYNRQLHEFLRAAREGL